MHADTTQGQTTNRPLVCVCPDATLARSSAHSIWSGSNDLEIKSAKQFNTKSLIWSIHFDISMLLDKTHSGKASSFQWQADPPPPTPWHQQQSPKTWFHILYISKFSTERRLRIALHIHTHRGRGKNTPAQAKTTEDTLPFQTLSPYSSPSFSSARVCWVRR